MGRVLTYILEEEPNKALVGLRLRGLDHHVVFDGDESEGEFHKHYPGTDAEMKGLYTIDEGMMSLVLTRVPADAMDHEVEGLFKELMGPNRPL